DAQQVQGSGDPDDVEDRVRVAELVEMDLLDRHAMDSGLGLSQTLEHGSRAGSDGFGEPGSVEHVEHSGKAWRPPRFGARFNVQRPRADAGARDLDGPDAEPGWDHALDELEDLLVGRAGVDEGREQHVSGGAAEDGGVEGSFAHHGPRRAMSAAAYPAPTPSSMSTHTVPGVQDESIARSAARPPKLAPYPTLVGQAMTGQVAIPPTTLASAPSIPAITTIASALASRSRAAARRCRPATPTSATISAPAPSNVAVSSASSATGRSAVPAVRTSTSPTGTGTFRASAIARPAVARRESRTAQVPARDGAEPPRRTWGQPYRSRPAPDQTNPLSR